MKKRVMFHYKMEHLTIKERLADTIISAKAIQLPNRANVIVSSIKGDKCIYLPWKDDQCLKLTRSSNLGPLYFPPYDPVVLTVYPPEEIYHAIINENVAYVRKEKPFEAILSYLVDFDATAISEEWGRCVFCLSDYDSEEHSCTTKKKKKRNEARNVVRKNCDDEKGCKLDKVSLERSERILDGPSYEKTSFYPKELEGVTKLNKQLELYLNAGLVIENGVLQFPNDIVEREEQIISDKVKKRRGSIDISSSIEMELLKDKILVWRYPQEHLEKLLKLGAEWSKGEKRWILPLSSKKAIISLVEKLNKERKEFLQEKFGI